MRNLLIGGTYVRPSKGCNVKYLQRRDVEDVQKTLGDSLLELPQRHRSGPGCPAHFR